MERTNRWYFVCMHALIYTITCAHGPAQSFPSDRRNSFMNQFRMWIFLIPQHVFNDRAFSSTNRLSSEVTLIYEIILY